MGRVLFAEIVLNGRRRGVGAAVGLVALAVAVGAVFPLPATAKGAAACGAPLARNTITPAQDAHATQILRQMSLDYVLRFREPGKATLVNYLGERRTRDSAIAALTWAESGFYAEAGEALAAVLAAQDTNPASPSYGYFPTMLDETATTTNDETISFFTGSFLIVLLERHAANLPAAQVEELRTAIRAAATMAGRVPPHGGTNQTLTQSFVAVRGGEIAGDPALVAAGASVWATFVDTLSTGGIMEANAPNYLKVDLYALGYMADYVDDPCIRTQAVEARDLVWWSITNHYHHPTRQLAGPHTRTTGDRMRYELQGIHFALFRESGERIPLPPPDPTALDPQQQLHAVLATVHEPSWPTAWADRALVTPTGTTFRERTAVFPDGVSQINTFLAERLAFGTWNRYRFELHGEARPLTAHVVDPAGDVGVLRNQIDHVVQERFVTNQNERSAQMTVVAERYKPATSTHATYTLEWIGTDAKPPKIGTSTPLLGKTFTVWLMGTRFRVRFADYSATAEPPTLSIVRPVPIPPATGCQRCRLQVVWRGAVPAEAGADGYNLRRTPLLAFGIEVEERPEKLAEAARALAPVNLVSEGNDWYSLSWASRDGLLENRFLNLRRSMAMTETVNGVAVPIVPLQASFPGLPVPVPQASFANGAFALTYSGGDPISLACSGGNLRVNGSDPLGAPLPCSSVTSLTADASGAADTIDLSGFPNLATSSIRAEEGDDVVTGGPGRDSIDAGAGNDRVLAGAGNDDLLGGTGDDYLDSGDGDDTVWAGAGLDTVWAQKGNDQAHGEDGNDFLDLGPGLDGGFGEAGVDSLYGRADGDTLDGGDGNDKVQGDAGDDVVVGGAGVDKLFGNGGADRLEAKDGTAEALSCGTETDTAVADATDAVPVDCELRL